MKNTGDRVVVPENDKLGIHSSSEINKSGCQQLSFDSVLFESCESVCRILFCSLFYYFSDTLLEK